MTPSLACWLFFAAVAHGARIPQTETKPAAETETKPAAETETKPAAKTETKPAAETESE